MIRRPPRSTLSSSSAASDVYKRQSSFYVNPARVSVTKLVVRQLLNFVKLVMLLVMHSAYITQSPHGRIQAEGGVRRVRTRGVRVYPYLRVYPTRPVPAGTGRVRVDVLQVGSGTGTTSTGTGIPGFPVRNPIFSLFWSYVYCSFRCTLYTYKQLHS